MYEQCFSILEKKENLSPAQDAFSEHARVTRSLGFSRSLVQLEKEKRAAESSLSEERGTLNEYKDQTDELEDQQSRLLNETAVVLPDRRSDLKLYQYISNIKWDSSTPDNVIAGYTSTVAGDLETFNLNTKEHSHFYITNQLWAVIGGTQVDTKKKTRLPLKEVNALPADTQ